MAGRRRSTFRLQVPCKYGETERNDATEVPVASQRASCWMLSKTFAPKSKVESAEDMIVVVFSRIDIRYGFDKRNEIQIKVAGLAKSQGAIP